MPNRYPLPRTGDLLERLRSGKIFTKLDLRAAYNLIRVRVGDEWKATFFTIYGSFKYLVMPFGLQSRTAMFQVFINHVLGGLVDSTVLCYLNLLIYSDTLEECVKHMEEAL